MPVAPILGRRTRGLELEWVDGIVEVHEHPGREPGQHVEDEYPQIASALHDMTGVDEAQIARRQISKVSSDTSWAGGVTMR